jgi:ureidoacrylate peracid hydrolase
MLRTLADKVRPEHCAILIVDVQNDFCAEGGAMHREGRDLSQVKAMVPRLASLIEAARAAKVHCIWIRNVYNTGPNWYLSEVWLEHAQRRRQGAYISIPVCEPDAWNGDFYEIKPLPEEPVVTKHRYGAFESSDLDLVLR